MLTYDALADDIKAETVINRSCRPLRLPQVNAVPQQGHSVPRWRPGRCQRSVSESGSDDATTIHPPSFQRGEIGDAKLSAVLRTLELTVKRKLDGVLQATTCGLIPGPGSEPGESRMYQPGDDVRRMDWSVTARTTHPHVRQMIADRELETWIVVDMSASLDFGTAGCEKRDLAVCGRRRDHLPQQRRREPARPPDLEWPIGHPGAGPVRQTTRTGAALRAIATRRRPAGVRGDLGAAIDELRRPERRRGMAVVISDFPARSTDATAAGDRRTARGTRRRSSRPRDVELPDVGDVILQDTESGVTREFTIDAQLRDDFARAAAAPRRSGPNAAPLRAPLMTSSHRPGLGCRHRRRFVASCRRGALAGSQ